MQAHKEGFQLFRSDVAILDYVRRRNEKGLFASTRGIERSLKGSWSGNISKKLRHLRAWGLLDTADYSRSVYERSKESYTYKNARGETVVLSHGGRFFSPAYMLGGKYLSGFYELRTESFG